MRTNVGILLSVVLVNVLAMHLHYLHKDIFFIGNAFSWFLMTVLVYRLSTGILKTISLGVIFLTLSNLIDELFFDPTVIGYNEYALLLLLIIGTIHKIRGNGRI